MRRAAIHLMTLMTFAGMALIASCSAQQTSGPAQQAAQPAPSPDTAQQASASGKPATEKHTLSLANYSKVAVTVTINGQWVGQWDANTSVPLDSVVQGKNDLAVELADVPKAEVRLEIYADRNGQSVNLLRLNFQDKPKGTYNYSFAAK